MGRAARRKKSCRILNYDIALIKFRGETKFVPRSEVPIFIECFKTYQEYKHLLPECNDSDENLEIQLELKSQPGRLTTFVFLSNKKKNANPPGKN